MQRLKRQATTLRPPTSRTRIDWRAYADDPVAFAEALGLTVWSRQQTVLKAAQAHQRVAIRAGRKVSKSNTIAVLALHNALCKGEPTLLTSSSYDQLKGIIWGEISRLAAAAHLPIEVPLDPRTGIRTPTGGLIVGRSTNRRENLQGYSGADALYIGDEASGLAAEIVEALEGNLAGGGRLLLFGNPTLTSGPFYDAFHTARAAWHPIRISSRESPNVTGEASIPGLATADWIRDMEMIHGTASPFVEVHVDGEFPSQAATSVITLAIVEAAKARWADTPADGHLRIGVDVAWTGDDASVLQPTRGSKALEPVAMRGMDPTTVASRTLELARALRRDGEKPDVLVDVIGIGAGVFSHLARFDDEITAIPVNVAESATSHPSEGGYAKLRDQLWFGLRDWLAEGGAIPEHPLLEGELLAPQYDFDAQGRYRVERKDAVKTRIRRSTDYADALALAIYHPPTGLTPGLVVTSKGGAM